MKNNPSRPEAICHLQGSCVATLMATLPPQGQVDILTGLRAATKKGPKSIKKRERGSSGVVSSFRAGWDRHTYVCIHLGERARNLQVMFSGFVWRVEGRSDCVDLRKSGTCWTTTTGCCRSLLFWEVDLVRKGFFCHFY